jgi:LCP family protein required for cell wall assembly
LIAYGEESWKSPGGEGVRTVSDWPEGWYQDKQRQAPANNPAAAGWHQPTETVHASSGYGGGSPHTPNQRGAWPAQPPARSAPGAPGAPGAPASPGSPGEAERWSLGGGGGGRRWRFWGQPGRHGRRIALIAGIVVAALLVSVAGSYFWLNGKLNRTVTLPTSSLTSAGTNWLITGSDSRQGLSRTQRDALHVGSDTGTLNSDSVMLLHMGSGKPVLISIPRDSYVDIPGHGFNKLNAALAYGGAQLLIQTVENVTGLHIDHYMGIGFGGLVNVVNKIGGVPICLKTGVSDSASGVNLSAGCHNLNGTQSLAFVRDRHSFATQDLQRIQDQRAFLSALLKKATSPGVYLNPLTALSFGSTAASSMSVDKGTSLLDLTHAALALRGPQTGTVPIANSNYVTSVGDTVLWNSTKAKELFTALKDDKTIPSGLLSGTTVG